MSIEMANVYDGPCQCCGGKGRRIDPEKARRELLRLRSKLKLTQDAIGEMTGCDKTRVSRLESGKRKITREWWEKLIRSIPAS